MNSSFSNIHIKAISTSVPDRVERNIDLPFDSEAMSRVIELTGIEERRVVDESTCSTDLICDAAFQLIDQEGINPLDIGVMVLVTQFPDYIVPSSAHIVQKRLGLSDNALAIQVNEGCSGYIYGLQLAYSLLSNNNSKYALVLVGDTTSRVCYKKDQSTRPLFGDAGSATLLYKDDSYDSSTSFELGGDGSKFTDIIMEDGGFRNPINSASFEPYVDDKDILSRKMDLKLDGMNVYMFGIRVVPKLIMRFSDDISLDLEEPDFFVLHQANMSMNKKIIKKIGVKADKALYSLQKMGNTACASIPITLTLNKNNLVGVKRNVVLCGFGIGMSWGVCYLPLSDEVSYYHKDYIAN